MKLALGFPSDSAVAGDVGEAGEPQFLSELQRASESHLVAFVLGEWDVEFNVQCPMEAGGRVSSCVSGELPDVVSVENLVGLLSLVSYGAYLGAIVGYTAFGSDPILTVEAGV